MKKGEDMDQKTYTRVTWLLIIAAWVFAIFTAIIVITFVEVVRQLQ